MAERFRALWKIGCDNLVLLGRKSLLADVRPIASPVEARLAIGTRRMRLG